MKRIAIIWAIVASLLSVVSCGPSEMTPAQAKETCAPGVVLVVNQYYYELTTGDGDKFYFSGIVNDTLANVTTEQKDILRFRQGCTGTAFFINSNGQLLTNHHVASPDIDVTSVKACYRKSLQTYKKRLQNLKVLCSERYEEIRGEYAYALLIDDYSTMATLEEEKTELEQCYNVCDELIGNINLDTSDLKVKTICEIGIAYDGTFPTKIEDCHSCVATKISQEENTDLAVLQLKDGKTPESAYIFHIGGMDEENKTTTGEVVNLTVDTPLYLIGYNYGFSLAFTQNGIKAQITTGKITQQPDDNRVMYNNSSLQGSSGAPVINVYGDVVAVNFAKVGGTDTFNFGIPLKRIHDFLQ